MRLAQPEYQSTSMTPADFLKNLSAPAGVLFRPMLMISLLLHGVVLMLPIPSEPQKPQPAKKQEQVKITQLPTIGLSSKPSIQSSAKFKPKPSSQLSESSPSNLPSPPKFPSELNPQASSQSSQSTPIEEQTRPESSSKPKPQPTIEQSESTQPKSRQQSANPIISQAQPTSNSQPKTAQPASEEPESSKSKSSQSQTSNSSPSTSTGTNTSTNPDEANAKDPLKDFLSNFPFPEKANAGALGVLPKEADESARNIKLVLEEISKYYNQILPIKGYTISPPSATDNDTELKNFQVSKGNVSRYLNLISQGENTIIFLSEKKLSRADLSNLEVETAQQREFKDILRQTIAVASPKELTSDIKNRLADGKYTTLGIFSGKTPEQLAPNLSQALSDKGFEVSQPKNWGSGALLLGAKKNNFTGYVHLIPTEGSPGTAIIIYDKLPILQ